MKIVYVPVTIPWNSRSLIAVVMTIVCGFVITLAAFSNDWYVMNISRSVNPNDKSDTLDQVQIKIGPWFMDATLCGYNEAVGKSVCHDRSLVFQECRNNKNTKPSLLVQSISFQGSLDFNWCSSWKYFFGAFFMIGIAAFCGLITFLVTFYREMCHGPWSIGSCLFLMIALITFGYGTHDIQNQELEKLKVDLAKGNHVVTVNQHLGFAMIINILICVVWPIAAGLTLSLCCCTPKSDTPQPKPPTIQVVTMDGDAAKGPIPDYPPGREPNGRGDRMGRTQGALEVDYTDGNAGGGYDRMDYGGDQEMSTPQRGNHNGSSSGVAGASPQSRPHPNGEYRPSPQGRSHQYAHQA